MKKLTQQQRDERFLARIDRTPGQGPWGDCWLFDSDSSHYGRMWDGTRLVLAHRRAYELWHGSVSTDKALCHKCDMPGCCNPKHLWLGTQLDNIADRHLKGRSRGPTGDTHGSKTHPARVARGERSGARLHPETLARGSKNGAYTRPECVLRGEEHGNAKFTVAKVRQLRRLFNEGVPRAELARKFGVGWSCVNTILLGRTWKHIV